MTTCGKIWEKGDKKPYILRSTSSPGEAAYDPPNDDVILLHRPTAFPLLSNSKKRSTIGVFTFRHCAGADICCHAAAGGVGGVVAGVDLNLVASEVAQVGDDSGLFGVDRDHSLCAFKGLLILVLRDACAMRWARGGGEEGVCLVGDTHHRASLSRASRQGEARLK